MAARREARRRARAGRRCEHCGEGLDQLRANARFCTTRCQKAWHYRQRHPARPPRPRRAAQPLPPVPVLEAHPLLEAAVRELRPWERNELGTAWDSGVRELVGEYVLAACAGADPVAALQAERRRQAQDRVLLVRGLERTDDLVR